MRLFGFDITRSKKTDTYTQPIEVENFNIMDFWFNWINSNKDIEQFVSIENNEFEIYRTTAEVKQVLDKGASLFSNGSWKLYTLDNEEIDDHKILDVLKKPNPIQSKNDFLNTVYLHYTLNGNSLCYLNRAIDGMLPKYIMPLPYEMMVLIRSGKFFKQTTVNNIIKEYRLLDRGVMGMDLPISSDSRTLEVFNPNDILHLKNINPNDFLVGVSPLTPLHMVISNIRAGYGYINADYVKKGALGMLSPDQPRDTGGALPVTPDMIKDLERRYAENNYGTADKQNKVFISNIPAKYTAFGSEIKNHLIHEEREMNFKRIIDAYGLNESIFSFFRQSTFNNQENGEKQAYQNGIIPVADLFASEINDKLKLADMGLKVQLDYSHVSCFVEDESEKVAMLEKKVNIYTNLMRQGWSDENAREIADLY